MRSSGSGKKQNFFWRHFNGIAMAAIVLIPTIYTTLFLGSMWDPYGNVDQLPVAVVNNDKSVDYEGKELAVGDELVDKLRENDQLQIHFPYIIIDTGRKVNSFLFIDKIFFIDSCSSSQESKQDRAFGESGDCFMQKGSRYLCDQAVPERNRISSGGTSMASQWRQLF